MKGTVTIQGNSNNKGVVRIQNNTSSNQGNGGDGIIWLMNNRWPQTDGSNGQFIKTNGSGILSFADGGIATVSADTSPTRMPVQTVSKSITRFLAACGRVLMYSSTRSSSCAVSVFACDIDFSN